LEARSAVGGYLAEEPALPRIPRAALLVVLASAAVAFAAATIAGAPSPILSAVFAFTVPLVPAVTWLAWRRAPDDLRSLVGFLLLAAILWAGGSLLWYALYLDTDHRVHRAGPWMVPFALAYVLSVVGLSRVLWKTVALRHAALDASVVGAAGIALAAALAGHGLRQGVDAQSLATVAQALAGVAVLALVASAALGEWQGLRLSIVLFGLGQLAITGGHVVYSYGAVADRAVELRWPELAWFCGALLLLLAAGVIAAGGDRPVRVTRRAALPDRAPATLYAVFGALAVTIGVAVYGHAAGQPTVLAIGLATSAWLVVATTVRASTAVRDVRRAYVRLDAAHGELTRARDDLAAANERLLELDRMKDELLSSVSHDMRTPLLSISGFAELLHDGRRSDDERRFAAAIDRNARRMLHMVDDLLLTAQLRAGGLEVELAPTDALAVARDCVESLRPVARSRSVDLSLVGSSVPLVPADRRRLEQALENVVSNALKFTPAGGDVLVSVSAVNGNIELSVADTGVGIAADDRARVFDIFYRSARAAVRMQPGIGLGLHLVAAIMAAHGGSVSIEGEEGHGTTVRLTLPVAQSPRAPARYR
jgi:signal transduction histidine kinase